MKTGNGYVGSSKIETSQGNHEVIPAPPEKWTQGYKIYKMSFKAIDDMSIIINGKSNLFLEKGQKFETEKTDAPITSLVVIERGAKFHWIGAY